MIDIEFRFLDAPVDVADGSDLADDDVEVGFQSNAAHAHRLLDATLVVHGVFLRQDVQDFLAGLHHLAVHVLDQRIDIDLADFRFKVVAGALAARLLALDVLAGDADVHVHKDRPGGALGFFNGRADGIHGFFNVRNDPAGHPDGFALPVTEDFDFTVFIAAPDEAGDFRRADIQANDDFFWVV